MPRSASLLLALVGGALAAAACYSEKPAPPGYRYVCHSESDCRSNELCIEELCQVPCTQATAKDDCTGSDHLLCFNGVCTSGCQVDNENCPESQECIDLTVLGIMIDTGGGGFISGSGSGPTGLCANFCEPSDPNACPESEMCLEGFCVAMCETSDTCIEGLLCREGLCLPPLGDTSGSEGAPTSSSESSAESSSGGSGDTSSSSSGGVL